MLYSRLHGVITPTRMHVGRYARGVAHQVRGMSTLDTVIHNARVVRPDEKKPIQTLSLGVRDGKIVEMAESIDPSRAANSYDANGLMAFPGLVDAHMHVGIYQNLEEDAVNESKAAAQGGVTSICSYIRTGQYYLDKGGSWENFIPEMLERSEGNYFVVGPVIGAPTPL